MLVGAGKALIDLDGVLPFDGFDAVHDPLHVRAVVLQNPDGARACLLSVDATSMRDGAPTWRVPAGESVAPATHLPAMQDGDTRKALQKTDWELSGHGALRLTQDLRIQSLTLAETNGTQCVYPEGHTLTVKTLEIAGTAKRGGVYTSANLPAIVIGTGSVVVDFMPTVLIVR